MLAGSPGQATLTVHRSTSTARLPRPCWAKSGPSVQAPSFRTWLRLTLRFTGLATGTGTQTVHARTLCTTSHCTVHTTSLVHFASASSVLSSPRSVSSHSLTLIPSSPSLSPLNTLASSLEHSIFIFLCCLFTQIIQPAPPIHPRRALPPSTTRHSWTLRHYLTPHPHITFSESSSTHNTPIPASISPTGASHTSTSPNDSPERAHRPPHPLKIQTPPPLLLEPLILATNFRHGS